MSLNIDVSNIKELKIYLLETLKRLDKKEEEIVQLKIKNKELQIQIKIFEDMFDEIKNKLLIENNNIS